MKVLLTGGAGYIGSHTAVELLKGGHEVLVIDNLVNSHRQALEKVEEISGGKVHFEKVDLLNEKELSKFFSENKCDAVIHFAGLKAVGESVEKPLEYYRNNLVGTLNLLSAMTKYQVNQMIFSSSATVYGEPKSLPITEDFPLGKPTNPYGQTKLMIEQILTDWQKAHPEKRVCLLRYFNPIGAHPSGKIGENPIGAPNNVFPLIMQVAAGQRKSLSVFGGDYATIDGTGVRDYIHVVDLAKGHMVALQKMDEISSVSIYNLGTGRGYSVLELIKVFEKVTGRQVPYEIVARREGDLAECWADATKAEKELGWKAEFSLEDMCRDGWRWQQNSGASDQQEIVERDINSHRSKT